MKRSALHHCHQRSGAHWKELDGWELPGSFGDVAQEVSNVRDAVGLADLSHLRKFESAAPQPGSLKLAAKRHLLLDEPPQSMPAGALDVTSVYSVLLLAGPRSRGVLSKLTSLNLSHFADRSCAQASLAHAHAIVIREDLAGLPAYRILVTRDYAESVWESVLHAGREFHITVFGLDALDGLRS